MTPDELRAKLEAAHPEALRMPALSIRQPWAWRILHEGKDIENRKWRCHYRGPLLIHAAKGVDSVDHVSPDMERGGIVGMARIVDCVTTSQSKWFQGPYGIVLADVQPLPFVPCAGALSFFYPVKVAEQKARKA